MTIFQIIILLFVVFVIYKGIRRLMKKEISIWLFLIWLAFWIVVAVINIFPEIIAYLAFSVGVGRGVDLVLYLAIFALLYIVFKFYIRINKIEKNISEIVRKVAIEKTEEIKKD